MTLWAEWMLKSKCSIKLQLFNVYDMVHIIITALQPEKSCELHLIVNHKKKNHEMVHYIATKNIDALERICSFISKSNEELNYTDYLLELVSTQRALVMNDYDLSPYFICNWSCATYI